MARSATPKISFNFGMEAFIGGVIMSFRDARFEHNKSVGHLLREGNLFGAESRRHINQHGKTVGCRQTILNRGSLQRLKKDGMRISSKMRKWSKHHRLLVAKRTGEDLWMLLFWWIVSKMQQLCTSRSHSVQFDHDAKLLMNSIAKAHWLPTCRSMTRRVAPS